MQEAMHVWRRGVYGKSPNLPVNFVVNLQFLKNINKEKKEKKYFV